MSKSLPIAFGLWTPLRRVERKTGRRTATVDEVLELLQSAAAKLRAADVEIRLPNCFAKDAKPRVVIRRKPIDLSESSGLFTAEKLLKFRWEVVLDGEQLDVAKLEEIAQQTRALFRWRGKWVWFDPENYSLEKLAEIAERMRKQPIEELSRVAAIHDLILGYSDWDGIPIETESGDPRLRNWLNQLCRRTSLVDVGVPNGLKFEGDQHFRHYQQSGLNWLSFMNTNGFGALLADDMGLGKTLQTLAWLQHRKNEGHHEPCLLICPTSLMMNWEKESHRFTPGLKLLRHHGNNRAKTDIAIHARSTGRDLVITTYGLLARQVDELAKIKWGAVILDESQNIKNPDTAVSKAARQIARDVPFRLTLTGTPVENRVLDLWTQFDFLNPGLLGTQSEFKRRFSELLSQQALSEEQKERRTRVAASLNRITSPFILRRRKSDKDIAPELPDKIEKDENCFLTEEQATLYRSVQKEAKDKLEMATRSERSTVVLTILHQLKQVCNHPAHFWNDGSPLAERSGKLTRLVEMLEEILNGRKRR